jgi:hypothetical protein
MVVVVSVTRNVTVKLTQDNRDKAYLKLHFETSNGYWCLVPELSLLGVTLAPARARSSSFFITSCDLENLINSQVDYPILL